MNTDKHDPPPTRAERRRRSRETILAAARWQFGENGFERTTIRGVASKAGVDPSLIMQHFGSKEALFTAAVHVDRRNEHVLGSPPNRLPRAALEDVFSQFENAEDRHAAIALMRNCLTYPRATAIMREEVMVPAIAHGTSRIDADQGELRSALFNACLLGLVFSRYVLQVEPLAGASREDVARLFEPALRALTGQSADHHVDEGDGL